MSSFLIDDRSSRFRNVVSFYRLRVSKVLARLSQAASQAVDPVDQGALWANAAVLWMLLITVVVSQAIILQWSRLSIVPSPKLTFNVCFCFVLAVVGSFLTFRDFRPRLALIASSFAQLVTGSIALCLLTYSVTALASSTPLRDDALAAIDGQLGFYWLDVLRWSDAHPALADLTGDAYGSITKQAVLVVLVLGFRCDWRRLQGAVYAYVVALIATSAVAFFVPALGAYAFFDVHPALHQHVVLRTADIPVAEIRSLRDHSLTSFDLETVKGIISFPSFHAALGVLFIWCFWSVSSLRWAGAAFNVVMIVSTPLHGSHYLTDVLAGLLIGISAVRLAASLHAAVGRWYGPACEWRARAGLIDVASIVPHLADVSAIRTELGGTEASGSGKSVVSRSGHDPVATAVETLPLALALDPSSRATIHRAP